MLTAIKEEIDSNTIIVGDFNTSLTPMDRSSRQKIKKEKTKIRNKNRDISIETAEQNDNKRYYKQHYLLQHWTYS